MFGTQKLEWFGYPRWKKSEDTITRFDRIHERDRHRMTALAPHMHGIARQKSSDFNEIWYTTADIEPNDSLVTKN